MKLPLAALALALALAASSCEYHRDYRPAEYRVLSGRAPLAQAKGGSEKYVTLGSGTLFYGLQPSYRANSAWFGVAREPYRVKLSFNTKQQPFQSLSVKRAVIEGDGYRKDLLGGRRSITAKVERNELLFVFGHSAALELPETFDYRPADKSALLRLTLDLAVKSRSGTKHHVLKQDYRYQEYHINLLWDLLSDR